MSTRFSRLVHSYVTARSAAIALLHRSGLPTPIEAAYGPIRRWPQGGVLQDGTPYFRHGAGIAVMFPSGDVDFDFHMGESPDAIDYGFLHRYVRKRLAEFEYGSDAEFWSDLEKAQPSQRTSEI